MGWEVCVCVRVCVRVYAYVRMYVRVCLLVCACVHIARVFVCVGGWVGVLVGG